MPPQRTNSSPDVILISIDTLRADRLGAYGSRGGLTPHLDALAATGIACETAIAQSSWTLPSVASFLTGLNPSRHGAGSPLNGFDLMARAPLPHGTWTLARGLKAAGYQTHAIVSNPYLAIPYGLDVGFDTYENVSVESEALIAIRPTVAGRLLTALLGGRIGDSGAVVTQRALHLLDRLVGCDAKGPAPSFQPPAPFFLWLHYIDPHAPYGCSGNKSFRGDTLLSGTKDDDSSLHGRFEDIARLRAGEIRLSPAQKDQLIALYDAGVAEVDRQIGLVTGRLRPERGRGGQVEGVRRGHHTNHQSQVTSHDPLIIVVADHGEEFWDHAGVEHGHTFYDELVRVPLILAGGGLAPGGRLAELVRLIDLPPTVLNLLSLPIPDRLDGTPFTDSLAHRRTGPDGSFLSASRFTFHEPRVALCESLLFAEDKVAARTNRHKYIRWANGKEELYDLLSDPCELRDLAATADLSWTRQLVVNHTAARLENAGSQKPGQSHADSAAIHSRMEALGYL